MPVPKQPLFMVRRSCSLGAPKAKAAKASASGGFFRVLQEPRRDECGTLWQGGLAKRMGCIASKTPVEIKPHDVNQKFELRQRVCCVLVYL